MLDLLIAVATLARTILSAVFPQLKLFSKNFFLGCLTFYVYFVEVLAAEINFISLSVSCMKRNSLVNETFC